MPLSWRPVANPPPGRCQQMGTAQRHSHQLSVCLRRGRLPHRHRGAQDGALDVAGAQDMGGYGGAAIWGMLSGGGAAGEGSAWPLRPPLLVLRMHDWRCRAAECMEQRAACANLVACMTGGHRGAVCQRFAMRHGVAEMRDEDRGRGRLVTYRAARSLRSLVLA